MARHRTGSITPRRTRAGVVFDLRFTATVNGKSERQNITLRDMTREDAERRLRLILAEVENGTWTPPSPPPMIEVEEDPNFHEFASQWFEATKGEWRETTAAAYESELSNHLLPFFKDHTLSQITIAEVDRYRQHKVAKGKLAATTINKTLVRLGQVLETAVERDVVARNPLRVNPRKRKVKASKPPRPYLDRAKQIEALLSAAAKLDREARSNGQIARRALLATLTLAGLRIGEALDLRWKDVDLAGGRLHVRQSKTDAGIRQVDLLPLLREVLTEHKAAAGERATATALVFPSATGTTPLDRNRVRNRVLHGSVALANEALAKDGLAALPEKLTPHALRRTFASILIALGKDPAYVMAQMGHTDPTVTLGLYAKAMSATEEDRERLRTLVEGTAFAAESEAVPVSVG